MACLDNAFLRDYRRFLSGFNSLKDCSWWDGEHCHRARNEELEQFRNAPGAGWAERPIAGTGRHARIYGGEFTPTQKRLLAHLVNQRERTVWMTNALSKSTRTLLMLVDLDNKDGTARVDEAETHVVNEYLGGAGIVEHSTGGLGRHVFFKCAVGSASAQDVCAAFDDLARVVRQDDRLLATGVTLDAVFYGTPTVWRRADQSWRVVSRGLPVRLPYVEGADLRPFEGLAPIPLSHFVQKYRSVASASPALFSYEDDMRRTTDSSVGVDGAPVRHGNGGAFDDPDASRRRLDCWSRVMRSTDGACTVDDCLDYYHRHYTYTGDGALDIRKRGRDFERLFRTLGPSFRPARRAGDDLSRPFRPGEYVDVVRRTVPAAAFAWDRRERLDHERLADFVGVKVQDAFFLKDDVRYVARASRDATLANFRVLREKGLVRWICTPNQYARLLAIAIEYGLLEEFAPAVRPPHAARGHLGSPGKGGLARMIGPGPKLESEYAAFAVIHEAWRARPRVGA